MRFVKLSLFSSLIFFMATVACQAMGRGPHPGEPGSTELRSPRSQPLLRDNQWCVSSFQPGSAELCKMNQRDADQYCRGIGSRLPTAFEFAQSMNPRGVSFTRQEGFVPVWSTADGGVSFFYDYRNYNHSAENPLNGNCVWTQSSIRYSSGEFGYYEMSNGIFSLSGRLHRDDCIATCAQ